mgnify:CR=1 FL=1
MLCPPLHPHTPTHTHTHLQVQRTIGVSDYVRRDLALKNLIQPLAGEYGMHNGQPQRESCEGWGERVGWRGWGVGFVTTRPN